MKVVLFAYDRKADISWASLYLLLPEKRTENQTSRVTVSQLFFDYSVSFDVKRRGRYEFEWCYDTEQGEHYW